MGDYNSLMVLPGDFSVQLAVSPCHTLTTEAGEGILPHLPHPSGSLPRWPFLSSSIRFFTQLLPRQLWGLEHPLGIGVTLSTRPEKGWVTTSKHQFLLKWSGPVKSSFCRRFSSLWFYPRPL